MIVDELKKSILDYAFKGKLIQNDNKLEKTFVSVKNEIIPKYTIPVNWQWVKINDVLNIVRGASPRPIKSFITTREDGVNWIKIGDTDKNSKYINSTKEKITKEGAKKSRYVKKGDFVLSNSMSFGQPYIMNIDGCVHDGWLILSDKENFFNKDFLYYLLSSDFVYYQFCEKASGAVVSNLNTDKVRDTIIPLPPLEEQQRIVGKIEELFAKLDELKPIEDELNELKKNFPGEMRKAIIKYALSGKFKLSNKNDKSVEKTLNNIAQNSILNKKYRGKKEIISVPFSIPETWRWVQLNEIVYNMYAGGDKPQNMSKEIYGKNIVPVIANGIINDGIVGYTDKSTESGVSLTIAARGTIGYSLVRDYDYCPIVRLIVIKLTDDIEYDYLKYCFELLFEEGIGTSVKQLTIPMIQNKLIPLPPLEEQQRIVDKLEELLPLCDDIENIIGG